MITTFASISSAAAADLVRHAVEMAERSGWAVAVCVTDPHGAVLAARRMDGATPPILDFARDKAMTAATMRKSTEAFAERMASSPSLTLGLSTRQGFLAWGGGLPVVATDGTIIGGIGVSGAKDHEDIACAQHALDLLGLGWAV